MAVSVFMADALGARLRSTVTVSQSDDMLDVYVFSSLVFQSAIGCSAIVRVARSRRRHADDGGTKEVNTDGMRVGQSAGHTVAQVDVVVDWLID